MSEEESHETSLAVWDIPSPLPLGGSTKFKLGVRCDVGCPLAGRSIEILDLAGNRIAVTKTGPTPLPGTTGLYWGEAVIVAPLTEGPHLWTAQFSPETPHSPTSLAFSFITVRPPEHRITVQVVEDKTNNAIDAGVVRLSAFRALTNENGIATLEVPHGTYELTVWKMGYEHVIRSLEVDGDQSLTIELPLEPEPSPFL